MSLPVLVFDVNETLLSLDRLRPDFDQMSGAHALDLWFAQVLQLAFVSTILDDYKDFSVHAQAALKMTEAALGTRPDPQRHSRILRTMSELEPHADARPALELLKDRGFRLVTLTNSSQSVANKQLANAGLAGMFEKIYSVESVRKFKPHPATYAFVAADINVAPEQMILVAAHGWDIAGATSAGLGAAFVARPGKTLSQYQVQPEIRAADLGEAARMLIETYAS